MNNGTVIVIHSDGMGRAERSLAHKLVRTYLNMLDLDERLPGSVCFYGEGVKLAVAGSPVLEELESLAGKGVALIVCTTCLNHYGVFDALKVGTAASMKEIVDAQAAATKVITL